MQLRAKVICVDCGDVEALDEDHYDSFYELEKVFKDKGWKKTKRGWVCGCKRREKKDRR